MAGPPAVVVRDVEPNPDYASLRMACAAFARAGVPPQVIVALGGGSVIDTAKVLAAAGDEFSRVQGYIEGRHGAEALRRLPIIAVPTTAGTGSEVTCWATVWDTANRKKYSLARPELYPERAVLDPRLSVGVPRALTISTGLDALSHALESIWNVNGNPVSANHAVFAACEVIDCLPRLADDLGNVDLRTRMARASLFAGLAFSNTKTALAHSLSYFLTLHHGVVHGIACSFSLPAVMRCVIGVDADVRCRPEAHFRRRSGTGSRRPHRMAARARGGNAGDRLRRDRGRVDRRHRRGPAGRARPQFHRRARGGASRSLRVTGYLISRRDRA